jgi:hypothetical protein
MITREMIVGVLAGLIIGHNLPEQVVKDFYEDLAEKWDIPSDDPLHVALRDELDEFVQTAKRGGQ